MACPLHPCGNMNRHGAHHALPQTNDLLAPEAGGTAGAIAGAIVGAAAGPPGIVAGAIIGGVAGAVAGAALNNESSREAARERELDEELGIIGGDIGAPNLDDLSDAANRLLWLESTRATNRCRLDGKRVAILVTDGFAKVALTGPRDALVEAGATTVIVSLRRDSVRSFDHQEEAAEFPVQMTIGEVRASDFDALLLPGGALDPDQFAADPRCLQLVRAFAGMGKPIAAICQGPRALLDAGLVQGKTLTSRPSIQTDLKNAGATWIDCAVVVDGGLVTGRHVDDIPVFNQKMLETFAAG
jgi:protease I